MSRIDVLKTYKIFIGGKFPRTESGRFFHVKNKKGDLLANMCLSSRKDFRNAVVVARNLQKSWENTTALNKGQILYRIAEMLEGRKSQFISELLLTGSSKSLAKKEVEQSIDRLIYYAGWSDKFQQIFSSVNPVASNHFNFSSPQAVGVVSVIAPNKFPLLGLISVVAPVIVGGNSCVVLSSEENPMISISFAEVLNTSDVPHGVVNILTGKREELIPHFASHMDVNSIIYCGDNKEEIKSIEQLSVENLKRVKIYKRKKWDDKQSQSPYFIEKCQEIKTTWHPTQV
ncbi:MAG: aldehyde dehydrogenase family protein [Flavobacteriales bacterium]|nr:aldehyde dehydrogenase family protein [Flavobacteriales bacterium]MBT6013759.1 aldehyde dehydrogenase family protein [Flavobacteriales bacterium]MBT7481132.1 aldehyde dehydrogenase family protein [Flavobacteriales bacterium]